MFQMQGEGSDDEILQHPKVPQGPGAASEAVQPYREVEGKAVQHGGVPAGKPRSF